MGNVSYLGLTCHLIDNNWMLNSFALGVHQTLDRHTSDNVSTHIRNIADEWGLFEKIFSIGTDNGRNIVKAVSSFPFKHLPCFAHTVQLIIKSAIEETAFDITLAKCHRIVGHFKHSPANNMELHESQIDLDLPQENLIQDVVTRWNSMYDMLRRMLKHKKAITVTLDEQNHHFQTLTEREWEKMEKIADVLQPCKVASELLGGNKYVSSSVVLPIICHLSCEMIIQDDDPRYIALFKEKFVNEMERRFNDFSNDSWLQISSALDSRFKNLSFIASNERSNVWQRLSKLLESVPDLRPVSIEQEPKEASAKNLKMVFNLPDLDEVDFPSEDEVSRYRKEPCAKMDSDPLQWWKLHQGSYPRLATIAKKYLSVPATTVPCERLFSTAGFIADKHRSSLLPDSLNMLLCLKDWL
ncbi:E3 SUMO-protein ligase ZBED1-like [Hydra vulgaris]|uniref:E3 SUMO-protein ligase ZBED1-like n=1 Tax=Hydra vulgaris TaxID=6087 RepID=A0ABM4BU92_HYDVU